MTEIRETVTPRSQTSHADFLLGYSNPSLSLSSTRGFLWAPSTLRAQQELLSPQLTLPQAGLEPWLPYILFSTIQPDSVLCEVPADGSSCGSF